MHVYTCTFTAETVTGQSVAIRAGTVEAAHIIQTLILTPSIQSLTFIHICMYDTCKHLCSNHTHIIIMMCEMYFSFPENCCREIVGIKWRHRHTHTPSVLRNVIAKGVYIPGPALIVEGMPNNSLNT